MYLLINLDEITKQFDWKKEADSFTLHVSIPANTSAEVWVPAKEKNTITENRKLINTIDGVKLIRYEDGYSVLTTGSGEYHFKSK